MKVNVLWWEICGTVLNVAGIAAGIGGVITAIQSENYYPRENFMVYFCFANG